MSLLTQKGGEVCWADLLSRTVRRTICDINCGVKSYLVNLGL
jgi:hypothetical protein